MKLRQGYYWGTKFETVQPRTVEKVEVSGTCRQLGLCLWRLEKDDGIVPQLEWTPVPPLLYTRRHTTPTKPVSLELFMSLFISGKDVGRDTGAIGPSHTLTSQPPLDLDLDLDLRTQHEPHDFCLRLT